MFQTRANGAGLGGVTYVPTCPLQALGRRGPWGRSGDCSCLKLGLFTWQASAPLGKGHSQFLQQGSLLLGEIHCIERTGLFLLY